MKLDKTDIEEINRECPSDQGIFFQPNHIPVNVKEPVIYMRWETGGMKGGNCWGDKPKRWEESGKPKFEVLDMVLKKVKPDISYLQFREIENLIQTNSDSEYGYYGNSSDYKVEYIILSDLEKLLETF